jgi:hypothetical protein
VAIVVANDELKFYQVVAKHAIKKHNTSIVVSSNPQQYLDKTAIAIVSKKAKGEYSGKVPLEIITTSRASDGDRFYIYKNTTQ